MNDALITPDCSEKLKIRFTHWQWECGDGCCYEEGTRMSINGKEKEVGGPMGNIEAARHLLECLKIPYTIDEDDSDMTRSAWCIK